MYLYAYIKRDWSTYLLDLVKCGQRLLIRHSGMADHKQAQTPWVQAVFYLFLFSSGVFVKKYSPEVRETNYRANSV